ncbi:MAG: hypothetical protein NTX25_19085 [Proteobacteria bacterium]|nr:hypothetical protein [Pseudomonadota bacterium]
MGRKQDGFSLVSVLLIMGILIGSFVLVSQSHFYQQKVQKAVRIKKSYTDINQLLVGEIAKYMSQKITDKADCLNYNAMKNLPFQAQASLSFATEIPVNPKAPLSHLDAGMRCRRSKRPSNPNEASDNRFHFCMLIQADSEAPRDSILNAKLAFAEFAIELIDLQTEAPLSCSSYKNILSDPKDHSGGMSAVVGVYWEIAGHSNSTFAQKTLSYILNHH